MWKFIKWSWFGEGQFTESRRITLSEHAMLLDSYRERYHDMFGSSQ